MPSEVPTVQILAPLSGVVVPLDAVPDPVFARRMAGDGVAIDPTTSEVLAPIDGAVTQLHAAHHALAVTSGDGLEVLVHVGLDTVGLAGRGFTPLVAQGARVERGQPLLRFDADLVAREARSLVTAVLVTSAERVARLEPAHGLVRAGKDVLLEVALARAPAAPDEAGGGAVATSPPIRLPNAAGLHARPAAVLATEAKKFASRVRLLHALDQANAKSVVAVMGLSTKQGDVVRVEATGPDAARAVGVLADLLASGCGETPGEPAEAAAPAFPALRPAARDGEFAGAPASPGVAIGKVFQHRRAEIVVEEKGGAEPEERRKLAGAVREAARQIEALKAHAGDRARAQILGVHLALLEDPDLAELTDAALRAGRSAAFGWREAFSGHAARLEQLDNPLLRERAADVRDVGRRVLALLAAVAQAELEVPDGSIVVADEVTPTDMEQLDRTRVRGLATTTGGSTSHVAILARAMGIPAVCGIEEGVLGLPPGTQVVIDGTHGLLRVNPDEGQLSRARALIQRQDAHREADRAAAFAPAHTRDGHRIEVVANVRSAEEAREAMASGAEGVGLLRSEFLFLGDRAEPPGEEEQAAAYIAAAEAVGRDRRFVIRTLDVGGDKPLSYLALPKEPNPFLGTRGIRVSLEHPELFRTQLRAILRAASVGNVHVMFPMIATLDELRAAKQMLADEQRAVAHAVKVGIMVEVPSAAIIADVLAREVDFLSIGTNDLTQYTLAMDRGHPRLAKHADALDPAVLRMIALTVEGAHEHGRWVGICGGLASDPLAVPLLAGLGLDELSVSVPAIGPVKATLARWTLDACGDLATEALRLRTTAQVRALLAESAESAERLEPTTAQRVLP